MPIFSSSFMVTDLIFRYLVHFEFIFVYSVRICFNFILLHVAILASLEETDFVPLYILASFVKHRCVGLSMGFLFCSTYLYFCFYVNSFVVQPEVRELCSFSQDCFGYSGSFVVPHKFYDQLSSSVKNDMGILIGILLNLKIALGNIDILPIFFLIHEHGILFHFFISSSVSFISILQFSEYGSFTSLVKSFPICFICFDVILKRIAFLLLFLIVYYQCIKKARNVHMLFLYPETLLSSFISSNRFFFLCVETLGFLYIVSCHLHIVILLFQLTMNFQPFIFSNLQIEGYTFPCNHGYNYLSYGLNDHI